MDSWSEVCLDWLRGYSTTRMRRGQSHKEVKGDFEFVNRQYHVHRNGIGGYLLLFRKERCHFQIGHSSQATVGMRYCINRKRGKLLSARIGKLPQASTICCYMKRSYSTYTKLGMNLQSLPLSHSS
jgi:hypothetical protein